MVCPDSPALLLNNVTKNFCCGISGSQYCCSESEFRQGIQIIRNSRQPVSIIYPQNQLYSSGGSHTRNKSASTVPPTGRLLSSDSDRQSMRHNRHSPIEYSV
ncbi:hypothetical protein ECG_07009 [Echinococcus granulosus]|nr:hypothetical protein ECG_07009 [Echinococcus granulosus]